jgi:hypothetical protein
VIRRALADEGLRLEERAIGKKPQRSKSDVRNGEQSGQSRSVCEAEPNGQNSESAMKASSDHPAARHVARDPFRQLAWQDRRELTMATSAHIAIIKATRTTT